MQFEDKGVIGPDLSFWQGDPRKSQFVNFQKMKDAGVYFCIIRVGQYNSTDSAFAYNRQEAKRVKIPRAFYWFLDYRATGKAQAELFWSLIQDDPGEGPLIVDYESGSGGDWRKVREFIRRLQELSGYPSHEIWIYSGYYYWINHRPDPIQEPTDLMWFVQFPLWLAWYTYDPAVVKVPAPWTIATMWQKGTTIVSGPDWGVWSLEIDFDVFNGGIDKLANYFIGIENQGGDNMKYRVIWSKGVSRRTAPTTSNSYTGLVYNYLDEIEVLEDGILDTSDPTDVNKKWVKFVDGLYGASDYPDSIGVPRQRMEKIAEVKRPFSFQVDGFKPFSGELEQL